MDQKGKHLRTDVIETNGQALVEYLKIISGRKHLCIEEGTQSQWLSEILSPFVQEMAVVWPEKKRGNKNDELDALGLAERMRSGSLGRRVYKVRQFWSYCGFGVVLKSSADWVMQKDVHWSKSPVVKTRGLNRNCNRVAKCLFKAAATTVITQMRTNPLYADYQRMLAAGIHPNMAKLSIARKIASTTLAMWKKEEEYNPERYRQEKKTIA